MPGIDTRPCRGLILHSDRCCRCFDKHRRDSSACTVVYQVDRQQCNYPYHGGVMVFCHCVCFCEQYSLWDRCGHSISLVPLWWALALRGVLGGNGTIIGASSNIIVAGVTRRNGFLITYLEHMKIAFPVMLLSIILSSLHLFAVHLR